VQDDTVIATSTLDGSKIDYVRAAPLSAGFTGFFFPAGSLPSTAFVYAAAANSTPTRSAYLAQDIATGDYLVTRGDVTTGADFTPAIDLSTTLPALDPFSGPTFAYDPSLDRGYLINDDPALPCDQQSPQLVTIDFATGTVSSRTLGINAGEKYYDYQMAIDPATHIAAIATSCEVTSTNKFRTELTLLNLSSGATTTVYQHLLHDELFFHGGVMLGGDSPVVGIDLVNHLILQRSMFCPAVLGNFDLNARLCLNEYDETGRLVKTVPGLFSDGEFGLPLFSGVNGSTRTGATMGQDEAQSFYIQSKTVQPYSY
jgi:hypothetical protein